MALKVKFFNNFFRKVGDNNWDQEKEINKQLEEWKEYDEEKIEIISTTAFNWKNSNVVCYVITYKDK